jgi:NAD(P)-dependent dehydrogenase (short-subunit alcohol dehydrogenase family)
VTGGASGIGRGIATALSAARANVVVADVQLERAEEAADQIAASGGQVAAFGCDVRDRTQVVALADYAWERFGRVDILCNNAGVAILGPSNAVSENDLRWLFEVNVFGMWNGSQVFIDRFLEQGGPAWICNTGSHHSLSGAYKGLAVYIMTKHAVLGMADSLRAEFGDRIGFSVLCPGSVRTDLWNSGRNRPAELGGSFAGDTRRRDASRAAGLDPVLVGGLVAEAIKAGDFYIFTHPQDADLVEDRYREQIDTLHRQWPDGPTSLHHLTPKLL